METQKITVGDIFMSACFGVSSVLSARTVIYAKNAKTEIPMKLEISLIEESARMRSPLCTLTGSSQPIIKEVRMSKMAAAIMA